ncbi:MAG TPA: hypothetical protein EYP65_05525 [Armatimonadetes bacterium]|nr:hypothetical protein [Armatimonadota bacterium]
MGKRWAAPMGLMVALLVGSPGIAHARMKPEEKQVALALAATLLKRPLYAPLIYTGRYGLEASVAIGLTTRRGRRGPTTNIIAGIGRNVYYLGVTSEDPRQGLWTTVGLATEQEKPKSAMVYVGIIFRLFKW